MSSGEGKKEVRSRRQFLKRLLCETPRHRPTCSIPQRLLRSIRHRTPMSSGAGEKVPARDQHLVLEARVHGESLLGERLVEVEDQLCHRGIRRQLDWVDSRLGQLVQTDETVARLCTGLRAIQTRPTSPRARRAAGRNSPSLRSAAQLVSRLAPADRVRFGETDPGDPPQLSEPLEHRRRRGTGSAKLIVRLRR